MWDIVKNPKKQGLIILILVLGYWSWGLFIHETDVPIEVRVESYEIPDTTITMERSVPELMERRSEPNDDYEYRIMFWDMILGHLSSILGSIAALLTPLITVYLNKKGYFNPSENPQS